jgi:hypothetical protein
MILAKKELFPYSTNKIFYTLAAAAPVPFAHHSKKTLVNFP